MIAERLQRGTGWLLTAVVLGAGVLGCTEVGATEASAPKGVTITMYDVGFGQVTELRNVSLASGENEIVIRNVPARLDPSSVSLAPVKGREEVTVQQQRFLYDLGDPGVLFNRYLGKPVGVTTDAGKLEGLLAASPDLNPHGGQRAPLALTRGDGSAVLFLDVSQVGQVHFPKASSQAFLDPTLLWKIQNRSEGPQRLRLSYLVDGCSWDASYEMIVGETEQDAYLSVRVGLANETGGSYRNARIRLAATERGRVDPMLPEVQNTPRIALSPDPSVRGGRSLRYRYRQSDPVFERMVAGVGTLRTYDVPEQVDLVAGETLQVQLASIESIPIQKFYVYDGVAFDRFRKKRRNDWNYGTEMHTAVETRVEFQNEKNYGLGFALPPGVLRLYERRDNDSVNLIGEDEIQAVDVDAWGHALMGPARGLVGERERVSYSEVRPLHVYDENFEIRLKNETERDVEVRVVEHLYRWPEYEIVKADSEYNETDPQTIEFRPIVKAGSSKEIHYTVRYSW